MYLAVDQLIKAIVINTYKLILVREEIKALREVNTTLLKRRRAKRTRLYDSGVLIGKEASQLLAQKGIIKQGEDNNSSEESAPKRRKTDTRAYRICRKPGYNARTCQEAIDINSLSDSESYKFIQMLVVKLFKFKVRGLRKVRHLITIRHLVINHVKDKR